MVLILIILEVLYESLAEYKPSSSNEVLILIILEVLYEYNCCVRSGFDLYSLNPYYTGSTL